MKTKDLVQLGLAYAAICTIALALALTLSLSPLWVGVPMISGLVILGLEATS